MDIATITPLAWLVACQYLLYAVGWGVCAAIVRVQRAAGLHWAAFMLLLGLGFVLVTERGVITETPAILLYIAQTHPAAGLAPLDDFLHFKELTLSNETAELTIDEQ